MKPGATEKVRSFIAIELPGDLKKKLGQLQERLKTDNTRIKWTDPGSIHLTLKFLGDVPLAGIDPITRAVAEAAGEVPPFKLETGEVGVFPNLKRVQVVWLGLAGEVDKLARLYQLLEAKRARLGFTPESRPFTPHLTLARLGNKVSPDECRSVGELIAGTKAGLDCAISVDAVSLMKSRLTREGAIHSRISSARLKEG
jgi:2'-5' RNA ligase